MSLTGDKIKVRRSLCSSRLSVPSFVQPWEFSLFSRAADSAGPRHFESPPFASAMHVLYD